MIKVSGPGEPPASAQDKRLRAFAVALADANVPALLGRVSPDIVWQPVGRRAVTGVDGFLRTVTRYGPATDLAIDSLITEGRAGAVSGTLAYGRKRRAFCLVCRFDGDPGVLLSIMSYSQSLR